MDGADLERLAGFFKGKRERELLGELDPRRMPRHVAVIMDGNGRWASRRGLPRTAGHRAGVKPIRECIGACLELGVPYLTLYSFSSENWRRPKEEVKVLMRLFVEVLEREIDYLDSRGVRIRLIGRRAKVPGPTAEAFIRAEERTARNKRLTLLVALDYGGRDEIVDAARALSEDVRAGRMQAGDIDEKAFASKLYTAGVPDPDLVARTSGEMRISNFLLWQVAYSELWVTATLWPDFRRGDLLRAIVDYQHRSRRFGASDAV